MFVAIIYAITVCVACERQQQAELHRTLVLPPKGAPPVRLGAGSWVAQVTAVACASETTANLTQLPAHGYRMPRRFS